jgi:hypothetical protein
MKTHPENRSWGDAYIQPRRCGNIGISQFGVFRVNDYIDVHLSLASSTAILRKDQSREINIERGRLTVFKHFEKLSAEMSRRGRSLPSDSSILAISCRNVLANLRCGAWIKGLTDSLLTVQNEDSSKSLRPYHFLAFRDGRFSIEEAFAESSFLKDCDWAVSGVPVFWDGEDVWERMLVESSDFSHLFHLPRGVDPSATNDSVARWRELLKLACDCLYLPRADAARILCEATSNLPLQNSYLHNCAGVTAEGELIVMMANGNLEHIGRKLAELGATRAIVLDNGGSSSAFYFPSIDVDSGIQLMAAPNFRPAGTAYLFAVLQEGRFCNYSAVGD